MNRPITRLSLADKIWNRLKGAYQSVIPRPKKGLSWTDSIPLVLFLALFAAVVVTLELKHIVLFANPKAFLLLLVTPWIWWMSVCGYSGLVRGRAASSLFVRLVLAGLFAMLLAEPRSVKSSEELAVMYLVDVSDSIGNKMMRDSLEIIANTARKKPKQDSVGLVTFGKNAAVEFPARKSLPMDEAITLNSLIDRDATNVEQGLSLAAAMLPDDKLGRIVMFSDGIQTEGNLNRVLDDLKARGISVDVLPIQYDFNDEVWLERLELPQFVRQGETYEAGILLSSLTAGKGTLRLEENGKQIAEKEVDFQAGKNRFAFPIHLRSAGYYEYSATIEVPQGKDNLKQNNRVVNSVFLEGEGRILIVYDPKGEPRDRVELTRALDDGKHIVEQQSAYEFARDPMGLLTYDCIIYCNVPADAFDPVQMQATRDAVFNYGLGFIMVGGNNSFGPGGYHRTVIEDALPVTMDISQKKVLPKGALVLVLHTCEFAEGNTWAKRITREAIKVLGGQDEVAAIDYEAGEKWIFKLTPASEYQKLSRLIEQAQPGDMPSFARTMEMSLAELQKSNAATKHVIIISDGDPQPPAPAVLQKFVDNQISVSTVAVFPHGGMEIGLLRQVAMTTGGRYYYPSDPNELPRIFIKEAKTLKRSMIQRKTVMPEVAMPHQILKGIEAMPTVDGYVITTPKPSPAMTVLQVMGDEGSEGEGPEYDPLLSVWQYGLGKTAAFTSDLSNNWSSSWTSWDHFDPFIQQMVTEVSRVQKTGHLRMWTYVNGNEGVIGVEDFAENESFLEIGATIAGPQDRTQTIALKQVGPRRYQATIPLWGKGRYHIAASPAGVERKDDRAFGGFIIPYSPEYLRFRSNPLNLKEVAERTGGRILEKDMTVDDVFPKERESKRSSQPIDHWFLIALACLVPLDVGMRRIQIDFGAILSWLGLTKKRGVTTQTMGALLERKQQVGSQLAARRGESTLPSSMASGDSKKPTRKPTPGTQTPATSPAQPTSAPSRDANSTTGRLLELKRKRQQDK